MLTLAELSAVNLHAMEFELCWLFRESKRKLAVCWNEGPETWVWVPTLSLVAIIGLGTTNLFSATHIPEAFNVHFSLTAMLGGPSCFSEKPKLRKVLIACHHTV